jgi:hypothetical protein
MKIHYDGYVGFGHKKKILEERKKKKFFYKIISKNKMMSKPVIPYIPYIPHFLPYFLSPL